jgi:hypothetical protein
MTMRGRLTNEARDGAKIAGDKTYHGADCPICGGAERYSSSGACIACSKWRASQRYAANRVEIAKADAARYQARKLK